MTDDRTLVEATLARKPGAFERLVLTHQKLVWHLVERMVRHPEDARDHDDAVFAEADDDPNNKGGYRVWVAIADVAYYVTPGSALDRGAVGSVSRSSARASRPAKSAAVSTLIPAAAISARATSRRSIPGSPL